jgi:hypothetical protein
MACQKIENLVLVAMGFFHTNSWPKATNTLGKKPQITLTKPQFFKNVFKKSCNPWKNLNFSKKSSK